MSIVAHTVLLIPLLSWPQVSEQPQEPKREQAAESVPASSPVRAALPWVEVEAHPAAHLGKPRPIVVQLQSFEKHWNPYLTRFGSNDWVALRAWSDEQRPWRRADWDAPAVRLFVRRGTMLEAYLRAGKTHQRFQLTVIVREHCAGQPWAEVVEAWRMAEEVSVGTIVHVARGITMLGRGAAEVALSEFERALAAPLPAAVRAELELLRDEARGQ